MLDRAAPLTRRSPSASRDPHAPVVNDPLALVVAEINVMYETAADEDNDLHRRLALVLLADVAKRRKQFGLPDVRLELARTRGGPQ